MAEYLITEEALADLRSIWNYTFDQWSERQADTYYDTLISEFVDISTAKNITDKEYIQIREGLYCRHCKKHLIFYEIIPTGKVKIIRVLHEMMDVESKNI